MAEDSITTNTKTTDFSSAGNAQGAGVKIGVEGAEAELSASTEKKKTSEAEVSESFTKSKLDRLHRAIIVYQGIFKAIASLSGGDSYLVLDDLYHIRRVDQSRVIDYFHRLGKSSNLWIKVGTIRHRSTWYVNGDPPVGMKIGDDGDEIDLDLTLERYPLAKDFLTKILKNFFDGAALRIDDIVTEGAVDRLVLASGGVARDFLGIFRRSIQIARSRDPGARGSKIGIEDVNAAAGEYDQYKREELRRDTFSGEEQRIQTEFASVRDFCLETTNANCFLIEKDADSALFDRIQELTDLRLVHKVRARVTISGRPGTLYEAYMLDVSQYTASRKKRDFEIIEFWRTDATERLRRVSLVYPRGTPNE